MTPLDQLLRDRITSDGAIRVSEFLAAALRDPDHGYYMARDPFGWAGDFITAPEISQVFGELLGLWAVAVWQALGCPRPFMLVELGPGRGTLMGDALRAIVSTAPDAAAALHVHLIEISPALRRVQRATVASFGTTIPFTWHENLASIPDGSLVIIANEFFDALTVDQWMLADDGWRERRVGLDVSSGDLSFVAGDLAPPALAKSFGAAMPGAVRETSEEADAWITAIAERLTKNVGAALIVDYGGDDIYAGDSLQAVRAHRRVEIFEAIGANDLSHHVDFDRLAEVARRVGACGLGPVPQGLFLGRLGIDVRLLQLINGKTTEEADALRSAVRRLVHPGRMGLAFKAFCLTSPGVASVPGFGQ